MVKLLGVFSVPKKGFMGVPLASEALPLSQAIEVVYVVGQDIMAPFVHICVLCAPKHSWQQGYCLLCSDFSATMRCCFCTSEPELQSRYGNNRRQDEHEYKMVPTFVFMRSSSRPPLFVFYKVIRYELCLHLLRDYLSDEWVNQVVPLFFSEIFQSREFFVQVRSPLIGNSMSLNSI